MKVKVVRNMAQKKLYRSRDNRIFFGVCGGLGEYLNIDANLLRIIFVVLGFAGMFGILAYLICAALLPVRPE